MDITVKVAIVGASATLVASAIAALAAYTNARRARRQELYSQAVKAAAAWKELLYRVRRRSGDNNRELIDLFHQAQDNLTYYEAWVGSDSQAMARSYRRLLSQVKAKTESLIRSAWDEPPRPVPGNALPGDAHPDVAEDIEKFMTDVRGHLSWQPWRRVAVMRRNRRGNER